MIGAVKSNKAAPVTNINKTLFVIHGWSGIMLGLLLYAVIVTGAVAVFKKEISDWSSPLPVRSETIFKPGLDALLRGQAALIDPRFHEEISVFTTIGGRAQAFFHTHVELPDGEMEEEGVLLEIDTADWQVLRRYEGLHEDIEAKRQLGALSQFLVDLHVRLYLPSPWGLLLTGILGLAMMVAAISGLVLHRRLIRDLFLLRLSRKNPLLTAKDRHVLAGSWNLVFTFLVAFTGCYFSFVSSFGFPAMAMVAFGGDEQRLTETVFGIPPRSNPVPSEVTNIDELLQNARQRVEAPIGGLTIRNWGRADVKINVGTRPESGSMTGRTLVYNGVSGDFVQEKPLVGLVPSLGSGLVELTAPLHFGSFAGWVSKVVWIGLGLASAYVVFSGMMLWARRRQQQSSGRVMLRSTLWMGYGLPLALAATPLGFFVLPGVGFDALTGVKTVFLLAGAVTTLVIFCHRNFDRLRSQMLIVLALLLFLSPLLRLSSGGLGWPDAWQNGWGSIIAVDIMLLLSAVLCLTRIRAIKSQPLQLAESLS